MIRPSRLFGSLCLALVAAVPSTAKALELNGGMSVGGLQIGTEPKLALSPFVGLVWRMKNGFVLEAHNMFSIVPGTRIGLYDRTAASLGYPWKTGKACLGPALSIYSMPVCGVLICNRVMGVAPGVHAQTDWYFAEPFGASVSANADWAGGNSRILSGGLVVMVTAGAILRFPMEPK